MEAFILGAVMVAALVYFLFRISRYSHWHPRSRTGSDDSFGNYAEQRFLEEDHPVTVSGYQSGAQVAGTRQSREHDLGYWGG